MLHKQPQSIRTVGFLGKPRLRRVGWRRKFAVCGRLVAVEESNQEDKHKNRSPEERIFSTILPQTLQLLS